MTSSRTAAGSRLASRVGLSDRIFASTSGKTIIDSVEKGLERVEADLAEALRFTDPLVDAASRYLYEAGGKRVRPLLMLLTAQLGDGANDAVVDVAMALEMTHLGSLYHDDVMDEADRRRGVPAAHAVYGNNVAILTGDLLFSRASQLMARYGERAIRLQADTFERLVLGQMNETIGPREGDDPIEFYLQVLSDKTGSLIAAAARSGVIFSNAPREYEEAVSQFGEKVGIAFQLLDDVIDLSGDAKETGKVPGTDLRAGVATMPYMLLCGYSDAVSLDLRDRIDRGVEEILAGADPSILDDEISQLRDHAATARTRSLAEQWSSDAVAALTPLPRGAVREALERFARVVADRDS